MKYEICDLVANADIADRLNCAASVIANWEKRDVGFPKPVGRIGHRNVWHWPDIERWHIARQDKKKQVKQRRMAQLRAELAALESETGKG